MFRLIGFGLLPFLFMVASALQAADGLDAVKKRGTIRVGLDPGFLPFEMRTPKDEWIGFDVEMLRAFAAKLGLKAEFVSTKWDGIIPGLMAGKYDVIASGMTITEERKKVVLFSDHYYTAGLKVLVAKKSAARLQSVAALDAADVTVLVKLGTSGDIYATKMLKKAKIRRMDSEADAAQSVVLGKADAFIYDRPFMEIYESTQRGKVSLLPDQLTTENFALAAKKSDTALVASFNVFLQEWRDKGGYQKAYRSMFEDLTWKSQFPNLF